MSILNESNVDPACPKIKPVLERLQGNILMGHGRDNTVHIFFQFKDSASDVERRRLIRLLASRVTSAKEQLDQIAAYKHGNKALTFRNLFLTARGYRGLGFTSAQLDAAFPEPVGPVPIPPQITFKNGMAFHQNDLADPPIDAWESGYAESNVDPAKRQIIDGMLLLANDDLDTLRAKERAVRDVLGSTAEIKVTEYGLAMFNADGSQNLEHFGYVDGRSQPTFFQDQRDAEAGKDGVDKWDPAEPLGLVLVPDVFAPAAEAANCFGSYFVFRKLEQNVRGFKTKEKQVAQDLGLTGTDEEIAGAMAVGRFEDGTPVVLQPTGGLVDPVPNNFRFGTDDPNGQKCPFHAHIRKMSPRGDSLTGGTVPASTEAIERSHRIARRGITYGERTIKPKDDPELDQMPTRGVGLLFMCFQALIDNQFAFMQRAWANNKDFARPLFVSAGGPETGLDPVIGQPTGAVPVDQTWPIPWGTGCTKTEGFGSFVTLIGGDFFFAPSLPFLRSL